MNVIKTDVRAEVPGTASLYRQSHSESPFVSRRPGTKELIRGVAVYKVHLRASRFVKAGLFVATRDLGIDRAEVGLSMSEGARTRPVDLLVYASQARLASSLA